MQQIRRRPLLAGLAAAAAAPRIAAAQAAELRFGALYPFSGGLGLLGDESFRGLEVAVEERNAAGGVLGRLARPRWVNAFFGKAQILSAAYMGFAHGHNDAQKTMGIIALTLIGAEAAGTLDDLPGWLAFLHPGQGGGTDIAMWIVLTCAIVMAAGTASGGWRIIKTLGHKMVKLHPIHGFAAETSSATVLTVAAHFGMPVSTTHSISTAIMGVGFAKNPRALKLGVVERIVWAWILTIPAAAGVAYLFFAAMRAMGWT